MVTKDSLGTLLHKEKGEEWIVWRDALAGTVPAVQT